MNAKLKVTRMFFDSKAVTESADTATLKALSRFGAYVRAIAKNSMKTGKGASKPGIPPRAHTGLLKRFLFFSYDPEKRSVIIGPERLHGNGQGDAPPVLEYGGDVEIEKFRTVDHQAKRVKKKFHVAARPYMAPAFAEGQKRLPEMWAGSIKA